MTEWTSPGPGYRWSGTSRCLSCGVEIAWWITPAKKRSPHDPDGTSHFATCDNPARFRKAKS
jgi:hypothetical protein